MAATHGTVVALRWRAVVALAGGVLAAVVRFGRPAVSEVSAGTADEGLADVALVPAGG